MCLHDVFLGFVALNNSNNYDSARRAFSQVVYQLRHLVNVWRNILPAHIYAKSLGRYPSCRVVLPSYHNFDDGSLNGG